MEPAPPPQGRWRVSMDHGSALNQEAGHIGIAIVQYSETAGPPFASYVDVGAGTEKNVYGLTIAALHSGQNGLHPEAVARHRLIELCFQLRMISQNMGDLF